jgi:pimeloyl-ACP methyl ester carboxylesterase
MKKTILYKGKPVMYRDLGSGQPVVLLHGFSEDGNIWAQQSLALQNDYRLIIPDLPGSGESALQEDVSMEGMAGVIKAILEEEQLAEAVLIGHSMGGYITLALAEKYPGIVKAFGLFHSTAYPDNEERKTTRRKNITFIQAHGTGEFLKQSTPTLFSERFRKENPEVVNGLIEQYRHFDPAALTAYYEAMILRPDRTHVLKQFDKPILFIIGKHDNAIPFKDSLELCHLPSLSYIHILNNSGHMGMMEETEKSNEILVTFLKDLF